ncbi:Uncharacterised protein [uncultured archaeon]|nr:Uncharacterised protein [uncultured archaeon]
MKGFKPGVLILLLLAVTTTASAFTEIGDNITVANNVTAQNFLGNLSWSYLLGIPTNFPNSTVASYSGNFPNSTIAGYGGNFPNSTLAGYGNNFPNTSVTNIEGVNTAQNTSISTLQSNDTGHDSKISTIQSNETGYAKLDGTRTVTGSWNWGGFNLTNVLRVAASFFEGDGSRLSNLNASNLTGTFNISTDTRTNFPNNTVASKEASWDVKTTLAEVNQSANLYNINGSNITSGTIPSVSRLPAGTVILLDANETLVTGTATNTEAISYSLSSANASLYSKIIAEAELNVTEANTNPFEWKFDLKDGTTVVDSFNLQAPKNVFKVAGILKSAFVEKNAQTISVSVTAVTAQGTWGVRSLRVYGVV